MIHIGRQDALKIKLINHNFYQTISSQQFGSRENPEISVTCQDFITTCGKDSG